MPRGKTTDKRKLHRRLAESDNLRIHRVLRERSRCVICATALVDEDNRRVHLKENPTLRERMKDPEATNGKRLLKQYWLGDDKGRLIGPAGEECGWRAIMGSWLKDKRKELRTQLLAAGVPASEIEDRLEQIAHQQWREMLKVYRKAEREAIKLGINVTTLTYDEIVEAIAEKRREIQLEQASRIAEYEGLPVVEKVDPKTGKRSWWINGVECNTLEEINAVIAAKQRSDYEKQRAEAKKVIEQNRAQHPDHVAFLEWALKTTDAPHGLNCQELNYRDRRGMETHLQYIEGGSAYPSTLRVIEDQANDARMWSDPWTGKWPEARQQPAAQQAAPNEPCCPKCGGPMVHRTGTTNKRGRNRHYDFYGCKAFPKCKGTMETAKYEAAKAAMNPLGSTTVSLQQPVAVENLSKAAKAAMEQAGVTMTENSEQPETVAEVKQKKPSVWERRKKDSFWSS